MYAHQECHAGPSSLDPVKSYLPPFAWHIGAPGWWAGRRLPTAPASC